MYHKSILRNCIIFLTSVVFLSLLSCKDKPKDEANIDPKVELKGAAPLPLETFKDIALQYKDAMDQGLRGNLVTLVEKNSRKIIYHTINLEHMIYFAAVNGVGTNRLILLLRNENPNIQFRANEIKWVNDRWKFESDAILNQKFSRPKIPLIKELLDVKITTKKVDSFEYNIYFGEVTISAEKYDMHQGYIPFYWEFDEATKTIYVPEICLNLVQRSGFARVDLTKSYIMRGKKAINLLDHPLFLWKGEVPHWAEQTMRNEKYFYDEHNRKKPKQ